MQQLWPEMLEAVVRSQESVAGDQFSPRLRMKAGTSRSSCWKFPLTLLFTCCNEGVSRAGVAAGRSCVPTGATAGAGNGVGSVGVNAETERALEMAGATAVTCPSRLPA